MLEAKGLYSFYGKSPILQDIDFQIEDGGFLGIVGRNGVGKTTLLHGAYRQSEWHAFVSGRKSVEHVDARESCDRYCLYPPGKGSDPALYSEGKPTDGHVPSG